MLASEVKDAHLRRYSEVMSTNFKALREVSQDDLANELGLTKARISQLETGKCTPSFTELIAYHNYFKVPYEYLLGESKSRYYENQITSKELGLSDEAIKELIDLKDLGNKNPFFKKNLDIINDLIEDARFTNFLMGNINRYLESVERCKEYVNNELFYAGHSLDDDVYFQKCLTDDEFSNDIKTKNDLRKKLGHEQHETQPLELFRMQNGLIKLVEDMAKESNEYIRATIEAKKKEGESSGNHNTKKE